MAVFSRDVTGGLVRALGAAGGCLPPSSGPGGLAGTSRANSSTEGRGHAHAHLLQGSREGGRAEEGVGSAVGHCDFNLKMFPVCGPRVSFSLLSKGGSQPATVANFATSWKQVDWTVQKPCLAVLGLLKTGNFKQNYFPWV